MEMNQWAMFILMTCIDYVCLNMASNNQVCHLCRDLKILVLISEKLTVISTQLNAC